jgi:hypothetical protein
MYGTCIDDLVDEGGGKVVLRKGLVEILEVSEEAKFSLFLINENEVREP